MSLQIIYGKSGTGKSNYCYQEIAQQLKTTKKIYIITPEQFSFTAEKKLLQAISAPAVIGAEVLTFKRMAYRVMTEVGQRIHTNLSSCGKSMLLYDILLSHKKELTFLGKSEENRKVVETAMTEFKKHKITLQALKQASDQEQDGYLKAKLKDMCLLYGEFQNRIQDKYWEENDLLTILAQQLEQTTMFQDTSIYIDEFAGFTKQEYEIIRQLLKTAKQITITICTDEIRESTHPETDIFYPNKQTIQSILQIVKQEQIELLPPVALKETMRFQTPELKQIEANLFSALSTPYEKKVDNLSIFLANHPYSEIEQVAKQIVALVKQEKMRYQEIAVITKDLDYYVEIVKVIFKAYEIPVFMDENKEFSDNPFIQYVLSLLDVFAKNWSQEAVLQYVKSSFVPVDDMEKCIFENFCLKWGIQRNKWYEGEWNFEEITEGNRDQLEKIKKIREDILLPLREFQQSLGKAKTVMDVTSKLYTFLMHSNKRDLLEQKIQELMQLNKMELANSMESSWNTFIQVLDDMVMVFQDQKIGLDRYTQLLRIGLKECSVGKIPMLQDQVIVGDIDRSRSHDVKAVFLLGMNDGVYPSVNKEEGFFNDQDREQLKKQGVELAKGTLERLYEDHFNIYKAFTTASHKLFVSYVSSDKEGKSLRPGVLIGKIKKMFPQLQEDSDVITQTNPILTKQQTFEELLKQLNEKRQGNTIQDKWKQVYWYFFKQPEWKAKLESCLMALQATNIPEIIPKEVIQRFYGNSLKTSISQLEKYEACPYSFYLQYGLKLKEKSGFTIQAVDTGTLMHEIIDAFFTLLQKEQIPIQQVDKVIIQDFISQIIQEKLALKKNYIYTSNPKYKMLVKRLQAVLQRAMQYIVQSLQQSKFSVYANELEFKEGKQYPPISLVLKDGRKVEITGKIDRIDIAKQPDGNYIRIIDYKSSVKNIDLNEVIAGLNLQLLTYLEEACKIEEVLPAGVLYFSLIEPMLHVDKKMTPEQVQEMLQKKFKMNGLILADIDVVKMMDTTLESGASSFVPAYIDKSGNLSLSKSNAITKEQFEYLQKYIRTLVQSISTQIMEGQIPLRPYYQLKNKKTACQYCPYLSICQFNQGICQNQYRYIPNKEKQEILEQIQKEEEENK